MNADKELLALLGVDSLHHIGHVPPPQATAEGAKLDLAALVAAAALWSPVQVGPRDIGASHTTVRPSLLLVPTAQVERQLAGEQPANFGDVLLYDSGRGRVVIEVTDASGDVHVLDVRQGTLDVWGTADALEGLEPPGYVPFDLPAASVEQWAIAARAEPWLTEAVSDLLVADTPFERAAAIGLLSRLWAPPTEREADGATPPLAQIRSWLQAVPPAQLEALETAAIDRSWAVAARLESLPTLDEVLGAKAAQSIILQRDELQSVRRVLRIAGLGDRLIRALAGLDKLAAEHQSALANLLPPVEGGPEEDRWHALAWQEPDAWWSGLS